MSRLPRLTGKEIVSALAAAGFEIARVKGSHQFLRHADDRCCGYNLLILADGSYQAGFSDEAIQSATPSL
jgi:hypothetical protein